jgi:hypothetical protein
MASDTSSDLENYVNSDSIKKLPVIKKETTETDLYLNLLANPSKKMSESEKSSSSLKGDKSTTSSDNKKQNLLNSSDSSSSSSKARYEKINILPSNKSERHSDRHSDRKSDRNSDRKSEKPSKRKSKHENTSNSFENVPEVTEVPVELTPQQQRMKKIDLLRKLSDIKTKGYKLSKEYDFQSSIEEMEYEYDLLKSFVERRNGIKLYKNTILNVSNIIEFANGKYDPFGFQLDGWSEHMSVEVDSYEDVMEELYEKYKGTGKSMPPELKLLLLVVASASAFHFTKSYLSKTPGLNGIMNAQPEIISKLVNNKPQSNFMSGQELNIQRQKEELLAKEKEMKQQLRQKMQNNTTPNKNENFQTFHQPVNFNTSNNITPLGVPFVKPAENVPFVIPQQNDTSFVKPQPIIKSNESVKDILKRLHSREAGSDTIDTNEDTTTNNDRLVSDTMSESTKKKKKKNLMVVT